MAPPHPHHPEVLHNMNPNQRFWIVIGFVVLITITEVLGQTCLKTARAQKKTWLLFLGIFIYCIVATLLWCCYSWEGMGHTNLVWSCMSIILALLVGYYWFKEPFNKYNWIAIGLAFGAIYFAHRGDEEGS